MAPIGLPCLVGGDCKFQTVQLEFEQAKAQLDGHMQYAHSTARTGGGKKPERFPSPEIKMDSSAEDWSEFEVKWKQYKETGSALVKQLYACCSGKLKQSISRSTGGRQFIQTEANLLKLMKQLAVRSQNPAVHAEDKNLDETRKSVGVSGGSSSKAAAVTRTCDYCGRSCESSASRFSREKHCPAWGKVCSNCKQKGHFYSICRNQRRRRKVTVIEEATGEDSARLNSMTLGEVAGLMYCAARVNREVSEVNKMKVPHMLHNQLEWAIKHPPPQPCLRLSVNIDTRSYRENKMKPPSALKHRTADMTALADTGCQAVCMGPGQLTGIGLSVKDLMEVDLRLSGANGTSIRILGGVFITITGEDSSGKKWSTKQLCYVAEGVTRLMLSKEACVQLGIINSCFPSVGSCYTASAAAVTDSEEFDLVPCSPNEDGSCSCPRREPVPEAFPEFDPKLSAQQLRKRIIEHYAASAFNRCTRQKLPLMKGEPLPIPVRSDVRPTAVHTPVPVPLRRRYIGT